MGKTEEEILESPVLVVYTWLWEFSERNASLEAERKIERQHAEQEAKAKAAAKKGR